jgi:hypothetical protein
MREKRMLAVAGLDAGAELVERAVGDDVAFVDDGDVGAEALDDLQHVRGEEDGGAAGDHALQHGLRVLAAMASTPSKGSSRKRTLGPWMTAAARASFFPCRGSSRR